MDIFTGNKVLVHFPDSDVLGVTYDWQPWETMEQFHARVEKQYPGYIYMSQCMITLENED